MMLFKRWVSNGVFCLQLLLIFFLIFQDRLVFPAWLQSVGRMHPLLLHLPIGLLFFLVALFFFKKEFKPKSLYRFEQLLLQCIAITTSLVALMGIILSAEGGYDDVLLQSHQLSGVIFSFLSCVVLLVHTYWPAQKNIYYGSIAASTFTLVLAGHFGASLTHGENFITQPLQPAQQPLIITDSTSLYAMAVEPIFQKKCMSCHNEKKSKGDLVMSNIAQLLEGGEHGPIWIAGHADSSELIKRALLPEEHDDHMPPAGKAQLTAIEIELLQRWIASGADVYKAWTTYTLGDTLLTLAKALMPTSAVAKKENYSFDFVAQKTIDQLNSPYCTVQPIASNEPALKADFYLSSQFDEKNLQQLAEVKDQLVQLNLSGMPVTDQQGKLISQWTQLEKVNLNNTKITGALLRDLAFLKKLKSLSLNGTAVDYTSLSTLKDLPALNEVYLWNTPITVQELATLRKTIPRIQWLEGYHPTDKLQLTPPLLVNETFILDDKAKITLKHNLPGTIIRYTLDGSEPDSVNATVYKEPIALSNYTVLKTRAVKEKWISSGVVTFPFFKTGIKPDSIALLSKPHKDYKGEGALSLIDNKKGDGKNHRETAWMGFQDGPAIIFFTFKQPREVKTITVGYNKNSGSSIMPPASIELWAGDAPDRMKLIRKQIPVQPLRYEPGQALGLIITTDSKRYTHYKLIVQPVAKLPVWHGSKGKTAWVFIDEVILN